MAISDQDIAHLAQLACLAPPPAEATRLQTELDAILTLFEPLQETDTGGAYPMLRPLDGFPDTTPRLRPDVAQPAHTESERDALMANAPATANGLFLVPAVIE